MPHFTKHYTREEAQQLLPEIKVWLEELRNLRRNLQHYHSEVTKLMAPGEDVGGPMVDKHLKALAALRQGLLRFENREIQVKDLDRGLIDFPAYVAGREVFLCWEEGEEEIEFWHDLDAGYAGRERL